MTGESESEREARLAELLADPDAQERLRAQADRDPEAAALVADLDALLELGAALDAAGRQGREERERVLAQPPSPGDIAAARAARLAADRRRRLVPMLGVALPLAAAAIVVAVWLLKSSSPSPAVPTPVILGTTYDAKVTVDAGMRTFSWVFPSEQPAEFEVRAFDGDELLLRSGWLEAESWTPSADEQQRLHQGRPLRWELVVDIIGGETQTVRVGDVP